MNNALKTSTSRRILALLLVMVTVIGLVPANLVALAADPPRLRTDSKIAGQQITLSVAKQGSTKVTSSKNPNTAGSTNVADWLGSYSAPGGVTGFGYCAEHEKTSSETGYKLNVDTTPYTDSFAAGCFAAGFPLKSVTWAQTSLKDYAIANDAANTAQYNALTGITEAEFIKATQIAVWHALGQVSVTGAKRATSSPSTGEHINWDYQGTTDAQRVVAAAKAILLIADTWQYPNTVGTDSYFGETLPVELKSYFTGTAGAEDGVDYSNLSTDSNGQPNGNPAVAYSAVEFNPSNSHILEQTINGIKYYSIYFTYYSHTDVQEKDGKLTLSGTYPAGTVVSPVYFEEMKNHSNYSASNPEMATSVRAVFNGIDNTLPYDFIGEIPNGYKYIGMGKICIPTDAFADKENIAAGDLKVTLTHDFVSAYKIYHADSTISSLQDFLVAEPNPAVSEPVSVKWAASQGDIDPKSGELKVYKTDGTTHIPLSGAVFDAYRADINCPNTHGEDHITLTTGADGKASFTIPKDVWYTNGGQDRHEATCTHRWALEETTPPAGYVKTMNIQYFMAPTSIDIPMQINVQNFAELQGEGQLIKRDADTKNALAGAVFEFKNITTGQTYHRTSNSLGVVAFQCTNDTDIATYMAPGDYMVREIMPPTGYTLNSTQVETFTLGSADKTRIEFVFENYADHRILLSKTDLDTGRGIAGVTFEMWCNDTYLGVVGPTNAAGLIEIPSLKTGLYKFREYSVPANYVKSDAFYTAYVDVEDQNTTEFKVEVINQEKRDLRIVKIDGTSGDKLPGTVFLIEGIGNDFRMEATTDANGEILLPDLDNGTYKVTEVRAPEGFTISNPNYKLVVISAASTPVIEMIFQNIAKPAIRIEKTSTATGEFLMGATYTVRDSQQRVVGTYVTDITGTVYTQQLEPGIYFVEETSAPTGYQLDSTIQTVIVKAGEITVVPFANKPYNVATFVKSDTVTGTRLPGAIFELVLVCPSPYSETVIGRYTTGSDGIVTTGPLAPGRYRATEVRSPDGYAITAEPQEFVVSDKGGTNILYFEDYELATLVLWKGDQSNKPVAGAFFKIETADGDFVGQFVTDRNGEAIITGLKAGHYIVTEVRAPDSHIITEAPKTITIKYGVINRVEFKNNEKGWLIIRLNDIDDYHPLENGEFTVSRESDGKLIFQGATDVTGTLFVGDLEPGRYEIRQLFAPDGYTIVDKHKSDIVIAGEQTVVQFYDMTSEIVIELVDSQTGETLKGGRFKLIRNVDNIVMGEFETGEDGLALASGLKPGWYTVEQLLPPTGYAMDKPHTQLIQLEPNVDGSRAGHVTFKNTRIVGLTIVSRDRDSKAPLTGTIFEVWEQNGDFVGSYTTDITGLVQTDILKSGFYVVKQIKAENGYIAVTDEQTVEIVNGKPERIIFESIARGVIQIYALDQNEVAIPGMRITVTTVDGTFVGEYTTNEAGLALVTGLEPGHYVVKETKIPDGFVGQLMEQTVKVIAGNPSKVYFRHDKVFGVQIHAIVKQTTENLAGVKFSVEKLSGERVGTYTTDKAGLIYVTLAPDFYVVRMISVPNGFILDETPRNVKVVENKFTVETFEIVQLSSIRVKFIDGNSEAPIYGMRVILKNSKGQIMSEYYSDNAGYITLEKDLVDGTYTIEQIGVPAGYRVDNIPKTIKILNGQTTEVVWRCYKDAGQIQVKLTSLEYNSVRDLPAGTSLAGAEFEVYDPFTYKVLCTMTTDHTGVAASSGLPMGRYMVRQKTTAPYYATVSTEKEVYIKMANDVVRVDFQNPSLYLTVAHEVKSNTTIRAGASMRYDFTAVNNTSNTRIDNFFWHIKVPTDAGRAGTLYTGAWNAAVWYKVSYRTNMNDYRLISDKLLSTSVYQYDLSATALNLQIGEYVTDIRFEFGTVPEGFKLTKNAAFYMYVLPNVANGYKLMLNSEVGGQYNVPTVGNAVGSTSAGVSAGINGSTTATTGNTGMTGSTSVNGTTGTTGAGGAWKTGTATWTTKVLNDSKLPDTLPKTGY